MYVYIYLLKVKPIMKTLHIILYIYYKLKLEVKSN